jgi:hypothetical protein
MGSIGFHGVGKELRATSIVEAMHAIRIPSKRFKTCEIFKLDLSPDSIGIAKGFEPGFSRDTGTSENDDTAE